MKRIALFVLALAFVTAQPFAQTKSISPAARIRNLLDGYCVTCHGGPRSTI